MSYKAIREPLYDFSKHPDYAQELGQIAASWALVEHQLCVCLSLLMRAPPWRAHSAYYAIINNHARITMLKACAIEMTGRTFFGTRLDALLERANTAANHRNDYIHKLWLIDNGDVYAAESIGKDWPFGKKRKVKLEEITKAKDEIRQIADDLAIFLKEYSEKYPLSIVGELHPKLLGKS